MAIVLILVYGGLLLWILPPFEDLRWTDEIAAQEALQASGSPIKSTGPKGRRVAGAAEAPGASAEAGDDAVAAKEDDAPAKRARKRGATAKVASKVVIAEPDVVAKQAPVDKPAAQSEVVFSASLDIRALQGDAAPAAGIVRVEVLGGARSERVLATWLRGLGGPPVETDLFGSVGVPIETPSAVSVRVPPGLGLRVICLLGERSETQKVKALERDATREITVDFGAPAGEVPVANAGPGADMLKRVAAVEASALVLSEDPENRDEQPVEPCVSTVDGDADSTDNASQDSAKLAEAVPASSVVAPTADVPAVPTHADEASSARLRGFLLDQDGTGVADMSIWLVIPWGTADRKPRRLRFEDRVRAEVLTAADGSFSFAEVPDGNWLVGVAPDGTARAPVNASEISRIARSVKLKRGRASAELVLRIGRGLRLRGLIEDSRGEPAGFLSVSAMEDGIAGGLWTRTAADGTFDVGPLGPGACSIKVRVSDEGEQEFGPFESGTIDVRIRLRAAAGVEGTVLDEAGQRADACWVHVLRPYSEPPVMVASLAVSGGRFEVTELELGVYRLVATAEGDRIAVSDDIDLRSNERALGIELVLTDGAQIAVRLRGGKSPATIGIARGARTVAVATVAPGEVWTQTVPAGATSVSLLSPEGVVLDQARLVVVPGEPHNVIFDLD